MLDRWFRAALAAPLVVALSVGVSATARAASVTVEALRIDNRADQPLGVDDTSPTFSWKLSGSGAAAQQRAYEVRVTDAAGARLWDSGRVETSANQATYAGVPLTSRMRVTWQVRVWDGHGESR